jgi:hypothetical protein
MTDMIAVRFFQIPLISWPAASRILVQVQPSPACGPGGGHGLISRRSRTSSPWQPLSGQVTVCSEVFDCRGIKRKFNSCKLYRTRWKRSYVVALDFLFLFAFGRQSPPLAAAGGSSKPSASITSISEASFDPSSFQPFTTFVLPTLIVTASLEMRPILHSSTLLFPPPEPISVLPISRPRSRETVVLLLSSLTRFPSFLPFQTMLESSVSSSTRGSDISIQRLMANQTLFFASPVSTESNCLRFRLR